jgi:S-adenosylmethionine hydrolase
MRRFPLVTLTTDIGWAYAAQIKAAVARSAPQVRVVDVAHDVRPQGVREAAFVLGHLAPQFPAGTIHVAVVDPGVGSSRAPLAIRCRDGSFLVGPDNGVLALAADALGGGSAVRLEPRRLSPGGQSSPTFEGRDLFGPAAAALAVGRKMASLGRAATWMPLRLGRSRWTGASGVGEVVYVDVFGNAITNLSSDRLPKRLRSVRGRFAGGRVRRIPVARTYADLPEGGLGLLGSSFGYLELAERGGSAARRLGVSSGDPVELTWAAPTGKGGK